MRHLHFSEIENERHTKIPTSRTGFGDKMPTALELQVKGRWRRVYESAHGRDDAFFIIVDGKRVLTNRRPKNYRGGGGSNMVPAVSYYATNTWGRPGGGGGGSRTAASSIPKNWPVQPLAAGQKAKGRATCGHCGLSWDDAVVTSMTPAPSARCPFEPFHKYSKREGGGGANLVGDMGYYAAMSKTPDQRLAHLLHGGGGARAGSVKCRHEKRDDGSCILGSDEIEVLHDLRRLPPTAQRRLSFTERHDRARDSLLRHGFVAWHDLDPKDKFLILTKSGLKALLAQPFRGRAR